MEYKKKLTDIFLRKQEKQKKEIVAQKPKIVSFDQSYFEAQFECDNINSTLMKVTAIVKKGANAGQQIPLKCRWYSKSQFDYKQIDQVKTNFFQPSLQDVGNIICVQIQPQIEGMSYTGITIMKQSDQLRMDKRLEQMTNQYFVSKHLQMEGKIEVMYSQNERYERYEFPVDVVVELRENRLVFMQKVTKQVISEYVIDSEYPVIDFNRRSFNSLLLTCSQCQSMKLSLSNNFNRDLFALIVRSIPNRLSLTEDELPILELNSPTMSRVKSLNEMPAQQNMKLILRLDEMNKEVKQLKRVNEEITNNYHLQRNAKIHLLNQVELLKSILQKITLQHQQCKPLHSKIKQVSEENNFYFGELALIKTELKDKTNTIKQLKYQLSQLKVDNQNLQEKMQLLQIAPKTKIESLQKELLKAKSFQQQLESENQTLKQKINELQNQKNLLKKKLTSIVSEKSLPNTPVIKSVKTTSFEDLTPIKDSQTQIKQLKMQVTSLEMLLKYKKGEKGGDLISLHYLVNSLTQKITQKQTEIQSLKKINKEMSKNVSSFTLADAKSVNH